MTILDKIVANKRIELETMKKEFPIERLKESEYYFRKGFSMKQSLADSSTGIISEFKRKSPSKGFIKEGAIVTEITPGYEAAGASGISVLADKDFFGGGAADVKAARGVKASGADVVLLIASIMDVETCHRLASKAKELDLETLLELYEPEEVSHIHPTVDMVGINNRNLKTFEVDLAASIKLCNSIPDNYLKVSESGISDPETVKMLRKEGFRGFLMGENFMKQPDPAKGLENFIAALNT